MAAVWVTAAAALLTALSNAVVVWRHIRQDEVRFADHAARLDAAGAPPANGD
jgi:hypothetical protein